MTRLHFFNLDRAVMLFAGFMVLGSLALGWWIHAGWLLLTGFVGLNMMQAAITGFCPAAIIFGRLGLKGNGIFRTNTHAG